VIKSANIKPGIRRCVTFLTFRSANFTGRVAAVLLALADEVIEASSCANLVALAHSRFWH
jgi:hypothetical protein